MTAPAYAAPAPHTAADVLAMCKAVDAYDREMSRLHPICDAAAVALGFTDADRVEVDTNAGEVTFRASWRGSFQSEDHADFAFPVGLLTGGPEAVIAHLTAIVKAERDAEAAADAAKLEAAEKAKLAELLAKYPK